MKALEESTVLCSQITVQFKFFKPTNPTPPPFCFNGFLCIRDLPKPFYVCREVLQKHKFMNIPFNPEVCEILRRGIWPVHLKTETI